MIICTKCKKELRCVKTGFTARWGAGHCYRGDKYACPQCGAEVGYLTPTPWHSEAPLRPEDVQMDEGGE